MTLLSIVVRVRYSDPFVCIVRPDPFQVGIPVATIRDREQGRKQPDSAAVTLLKVAQKHPEVLEDIAA